MNKVFAAKFSALKDKIAEVYGVARVDQAFSIDPDMEVVLNNDIMLRSNFLQSCNIFGRDQLKGGSLRIGAHNMNTRRADTKNGDPRVLGSPRAWVENEYAMIKTHSDFGIHDDDMATWSQFRDFASRYRIAYQEGIANDRLIIGFHGTSATAATSDLVANPLMQDMNVGWFELVRTRAPANFITEGGTAGEVKIGTGVGEDYANLDEVIHDLKSAIPVHRRRGLVAVVGSGILAGAQAKLYALQGNTPSEKERILNNSVIAMYGGLPVIEADFFPDNAIMVTPLTVPGVNGVTMSNLSIYYQTGSWKRLVDYRPELETTIDWNARHEAYHVEDLDAIRILQSPKITVGTLVIEPTVSDFVAAYS